MRTLAVQPKLVELVRDAILAEIASGRLPSGARIPEDRIAQELGVPARPVHKAALALRSLGVLCDGPGQALQVAPLEADRVRDMYEVRAVLEGLAFRQAALRNAKLAAIDGASLIAAGRQAEAQGHVADMIEADLAFHDYIYALSGNLLIAPAIEAHWTDLQRVMGEALMPGTDPGDVWDQHEAMLSAVGKGDAEEAERLARAHVQRAGEKTLARLRSIAPQPAA